MMIWLLVTVIQGSGRDSSTQQLLNTTIQSVGALETEVISKDDEALSYENTHSCCA